MGGVPRSNDLGSRIDRLERAVANLQRQSTLSSASISEGNLTVRRGGSIRVIDDGSIIGEGTGELDWAGDAHFGGNLLIDGDTTLGGNLTFGDNVIPPEALMRRTEARTYSTNGDGNGNTRTQSLSVTMPTWAATASVIAIGTSAVTASSLQILSRISIGGQNGSEMTASSDLSVTVTAAHGRTFSPSSSFTVSVFAGAQGTGSHYWTQSLVVMAVFTN